MTHDLDFKNTQVAADIFIDLIEIMEDCTIDDIDIIFTCLKAITNLTCETVLQKLNKNADQSKKPILKRLDEV